MKPRMWALLALGFLLLVLVASLGGDPDSPDGSAAAQGTPAPQVTPEPTATSTPDPAQAARAERRDERTCSRAVRDGAATPPGCADYAAELAASAPEEEADCHPSYTGACLKPDSPDYDCEGGSGDGPDYTGAVQVAGDDPYDLDRDGDGSACEA